MASKRKLDKDSIAFWQNVAKVLKVFPQGIYTLLEKYFRLEIEGLENVPKNSRALIVPNHSNALGFDAFMLILALQKHGNIFPKTMTHKFWFSTPELNELSRSFDMFPADLKEGLRNLANDKQVVIFPEAEHGNFKVSSSMYRLVDFNPGFVPLAIMQRAPVIPTVIIGAEDTHFNLGTTDIFKSIIGQAIPLPLNIIPFPAKWKIKFLKPIDFSKYNKKDIKDARFVKEINQYIRYRIQHELNKQVQPKKFIFI